MRYVGSLAVSIALASCASNTTTLSIQAIGEPGVTVWYGDMAITLDADGRGALVVPRLHVLSLGTDDRLVDAHDATVTLRFERGQRFVNLFPVCVIVPPTDAGPIDGAELLLRREISTGICALVSPALEQSGARLPNNYDPARFDDQPCGPFRAP